MTKKIMDKIEGFDVEAQACGTKCNTYTNQSPSGIPNTTGPGAIYVCECKSKLYSKGANSNKSK